MTARPHRTIRRLGAVVAAACCLIGAGACEGGLDPTPDDGSPPGLDVGEPFAIDRGDDGLQTPGKYKGLWLRLADNGEPVVEPVENMIGVVCLGPEIAKQECGDFVARITSHWIGDVADRVRVMNCGRDDFGLEDWIDPAFDHQLWNLCRAGLFLVGLTTDQIRVVYHKAANSVTTGAGGAPLPTYPHLDSNYERYYDNLTSFSARVPTFFPNVQAVYTSSRSFRGFSEDVATGEPLGYEEGHALNSWLSANPSVAGVWYGWGAYTWAPPCQTGETNAGGVCYDREDYEDDGVHPSPRGAGKVSFLMHFRLLRERWYRR